MANASSVVRTDITPDVLKNSGVPVKVYGVRSWQERGATKFAPDKPVSQEINIRFDNWQLHLVEDQFTNLARFNDLLGSRPWTTVMMTISIIMDWEPERTAAAMVQDSIREYVAAIATAFSLAMGEDPKAELDDLIQRLEVNQNAPATDQTAPSSTSTDASDGSSVGTPGPDSAATSTSSGASVLASSSPS